MRTGTDAISTMVDATAHLQRAPKLHSSRASDRSVPVGDPPVGRNGGSVAPLADRTEQGIARLFGYW